MIPVFVRVTQITLLLLVMACGSVTVHLDSEIKDETDVTHDLQYEISGAIASKMAEEFDGNELPERCTHDITSEEIKISCKELSSSGLEKAGDQDEGFDFKVTKTDKGSHWEYRASMGNFFFSTQDELDELEDNPFAEGMDIDMILRMRFHWTVKMPGEITDGNADTFEEGVASFTAKLDDPREEFVVVSREKKPRGLFGSCN